MHPKFCKCTQGSVHFSWLWSHIWGGVGYSLDSVILSEQLCWNRCTTIWISSNWCCDLCKKMFPLSHCRLIAYPFLDRCDLILWTSSYYKGRSVVWIKSPSESRKLLSAVQNGKQDLSGSFLWWTLSVGARSVPLIILRSVRSVRYLHCTHCTLSSLEHQVNWRQFFWLWWSLAGSWCCNVWSDAEFLLHHLTWLLYDVSRLMFGQMLVKGVFCRPHGVQDP